MKLTAIIPTKNEQEFIPNALKSVSFADEILVLDSGSTDRTIDIAAKAGARVIKYQWQGFNYVHDLGAKKAKGDWLLYIDSDERVSQKLKTNIQSTLKNPQHNAYQVNRKNYILGEPLMHGGWYPDKVTRLIKKDSLVKWIGDLHEYPHTRGSTGQLDGEIIHLTHRGIAWMLKKSAKYTKMSAEILQHHNHPKVKVKNLFGAMAREFYARAIRHGGWKDGVRGWIEIIYQTFNAFLIQAQLWELQRNQNMQETYKKLDAEISSEL